MTPPAQLRTTSGPGTVSEIAFARAQRNTVLIVDDLFSSRLLLAEIVRQIDGKLNLELFDTPSRALEPGQIRQELAEIRDLLRSS